MELGQAIKALHSWFGDGPFQIWQLDDSQVEQLVELTDNRGTTNIGRWLSSLNGNLIVVESSEYSVTVVSGPSGPKREFTGLAGARETLTTTHLHP